MFVGSNELDSDLKSCSCVSPTAYRQTDRGDTATTLIGSHLIFHHRLIILGKTNGSRFIQQSACVYSDSALSIVGGSNKTRVTTDEAGGSGRINCSVVPPSGMLRGDL